MRKPGRFISFEGGEGVGKSTQARLLATTLADKGLDAVLTREPGGTTGAEAIRSLLLDLEDSAWNPAAEALLFAAARSDHVARLIAPALREGRWVLCDRFVDSSRAYQGCAGGLGDDTVLALHRIGSEGLMPDCTVLLTLPSHAAAGRLQARDGNAADRIGGRGADYHGSVAAAFARIAASEPRRFIVVNGGGGDPDDVHAEVLAKLASRFPELA